jgi:hypothetical protein
LKALPAAVSQSAEIFFQGGTGRLLADPAAAATAAASLSSPSLSLSSTAHAPRKRRHASAFGKDQHADSDSGDVQPVGQRRRSQSSRPRASKRRRRRRRRATPAQESCFDDLVCDDDESEWAAIERRSKALANLEADQRTPHLIYAVDTQAIEEARDSNFLVWRNVSRSDATPTLYPNSRTIVPALDARIIQNNLFEQQQAASSCMIAALQLISW